MKHVKKHKLKQQKERKNHNGQILLAATYILANKTITEIIIYIHSSLLQYYLILQKLRQFLFICMTWFDRRIDCYNEIDHFKKCHMMKY